MNNKPFNNYVHSYLDFGISFSDGIDVAQEIMYQSFLDTISS